MKLVGRLLNLSRYCISMDKVNCEYCMKVLDSKNASDHDGGRYWCSTKCQIEWGIKVNKP
jgi:hypothetical protein